MFTRRVLFLGVAALALFAVAVTAGKGGKPQPPPPADPAILYNLKVPYKGQEYIIDQDSGIAVMNEDGSNQTTLVSVSTHGIAASAANWAPDNRRIAFCGFEPDNHWRIYVADLDTTNGVRAVNIRTLYRNPVTYWAAANPGWSADGNWVFFGNWIEVYPGSGAGRLPGSGYAWQEIFAIRADGTGDLLQLTFTEDRNEKTPSADRYGRFIAYKGGAAVYKGMLAWDSEGRPSIVEEICLTDSGPLAGLDCGPPKISPDGTRVTTFAGGSRWTVPVDYPGTAEWHAAPAGVQGGGCWLNDHTLVYTVEMAKPHQIHIAKGDVDYTGDQTILVTAPGPSGIVNGPNARWWRAP